VIGRRRGRARRTGKRRRFRFSLNALAIQLSAFALSFTLVAVLVVSGSQAAFVEQNESVLEDVPVPTAAVPAEGGDIRRPSDRRPATATPSVPPTPLPTEVLRVEEPEETAEPTEPEPSEEPVEPVVPEVPATQIELTDSDAGTAMFGDLTLAPGVTVDRCIEVTYAGNVDPGPVLLYAASVSGDLAPYLDLTIQMGADTAGSFGGCSGFSASATLFSGTLAQFDADHGSYATGRPTWDPADAQESRSFRFGVTVRDTPAAAGKSAAFGFSWRTEVE
jgi:hypothetical protein